MVAAFSFQFTANQQLTQSRFQLQIHFEKTLLEQSI
jgi:hypothetical protein